MMLVKERDPLDWEVDLLKLKKNSRKKFIEWMSSQEVRYTMFSASSLRDYSILTKIEMRELKLMLRSRRENLSQTALYGLNWKSR